MIAQIVNIKNVEVLRRYLTKYQINPQTVHNYSYVFELRKLSKEYLEIAGSLLLNKISFILIKDDLIDVIYLGNSFDHNEITNKSNVPNCLFLEIEKAINNFNNFEEITKTKLHSYGLNNLNCNNMGIINITPDSFSDGGECLTIETAYNKCINLLKTGADILDIGGESSRPGSLQISCDEEEQRVLPLVKKIIENNPEVLISIDTTKSVVAKKSLQLGAKIINDISCFSFDDQMISVLEEYKPVVVIMHMLGSPETMQISPCYNDVVNEIYDFFIEKIRKLEKLNIKKIFLDPGIGFGKRVSDNLEILNRLSDFKSLGYPLFIGLSRKSFLGKLTESEVNSREIETIVMETISVLNGAAVIRTHNTENVSKMLTLINNYKNFGKINV